MSLPQQHVILNVYQLFSHRRYWIVPNIMELTSRYKVTHSNGFIRILLSIPTNISDHNVRGRQIFPASGFLEAASQTMIAFMNPSSLVSFVKDVAIVAPLIMKVSGSTIIDSDPIQGTFCIESHVRQHCYGHFSNRKSEDYRRVRGKEYFSQIMIEKISFGVAVCASANALSSSEKYLIHPSLLDAILQLNISSEVCINASLHNGKLHLPASASSYQISSSGEIDKMYSRWNLAGNFNQCFDNKHSNTISGIRRTASIFQLEYKILREGPKMSECQASLDKVNGTINSCSFYALQSIFESNERSFESITTVIDASRKCLGLFVNLFVSNKMKDHFLVLNTSEESPLQMSLAIFKNECQMNHPSQKLERNILRKEILETNVVIDSQKNMCLTPLEPNIICIKATTLLADICNLTQSKQELRGRTYNHFDEAEDILSFNILHPYNSSIAIRYLQKVPPAFQNQHMICGAKKISINAVSKFSAIRSLIRIPKSHVYYRNAIKTYRYIPICIVSGTGSLGILAGLWIHKTNICTFVIFDSRAGRLKGMGSSDFYALTLTINCKDITKKGIYMQRCISCSTIHTAGVLRDASIFRQSPEIVRAVFAPKVVGYKNIINPINANLFTIAFSSITAQIPSIGQANYSSANATLDVLVTKNFTSGLPVCSIRWGAWGEIGMATRSSRTQNQLKSLGIGLLNPQIGLSALATIISSITACSSVGDKGIYVVYKIEESIKEEKMIKVSTPNAMGSTWPGNMKRTDIYEIVSQAVFGTIGKDVGAEQPLMEAGIDSLVASELANTLSTLLNIFIPTTIAFDYPTVSHIVDYLLSLRDEVKVDTDVIDIEHEHKVSNHSCVIHETSGQILRKFDLGIDGISCIPLKKWNTENMPSISARFGSFINNIEMFDASIFSINSVEAQMMDPQQRLLLMEVLNSKACVKKLTDCSEILPEVGVYIGITSNYFNISFVTKFTHYSATGQQPSVASGRLSYIFGWIGPALSIDTACSSSLVGVHQGFIYCNTAEYTTRKKAVCSGCHIITSQWSTMLCDAAGMLSTDGRCKALDDRADGYVRGEAIEILTIERKENVMKSSCVMTTTVNQDGRSSALTAPNGYAQYSIIKESLNSICTDAKVAINGAELHGTGTVLGDPIELGSIQKAILHYGKKNEAIVLSAIKSLLGHGETGAGITSLLCGLKKTFKLQCSGIMHLISINKHIILNLSKSLLFSVPRCHKYYSIKNLIHISISSFAFQGTNAHSIICTHFNQYFLVQNPAKLFLAETHWPVPLKLFSQSYFFEEKGSNILHVCFQLDHIEDASSLRDHKVCSKSILPAASFLQISQISMIAILDNSESFFISKSTISKAFNMNAESSYLVVDVNPIHGVIRFRDLHTNLFSSEVSFLFSRNVILDTRFVTGEFEILRCSKPSTNVLGMIMDKKLAYSHSGPLDSSLQKGQMISHQILLDKNSSSFFLPVCLEICVYKDHPLQIMSSTKASLSCGDKTLESMNITDSNLYQPNIVHCLARRTFHPSCKEKFCRIVASTRKCKIFFSEILEDGLKKSRSDFERIINASISRVACSTLALYQDASRNSPMHRTNHRIITAMFNCFQIESSQNTLHGLQQDQLFSSPTYFQNRYLKELDHLKKLSVKKNVKKKRHGRGSRENRNQC
jgi:3-oxoacyl-(acyl-carrier-protein) synthase/acyl carrier protein